MKLTGNKLLHPNWIALLLVSLFIGLCCHLMSYPGLMYDELHFLAAAQWNTSDGIFMFKQFHRVPILVTPYMGALKAYLYYPIFKIFGSGVWSIRLPSVLISGASILIWFKIFERIAGVRYALALLLICAVDPTGIFFAKADWGPTSLGLLFRSLLFLALLKLNLRSWKSLLIIPLILVLGLFNKLNFLWATSAYAGAYLLTFHRGLLQKYSKKELILPTALFLGIAVPAFYWSRHVAGTLPYPVSNNWPDRFSNYFKVMQETFNGTGQGKFFFNDFELPVLPFYLFVFTFVGGFFYLRRITLLERFTLLSFVLLCIAILATKLATGAHHFFEIWPINWVIFLIFLKHLPLKKWARSLTVATLALCLVSGVFKYYSEFKHSENYNTIWSPEIYRFASLVGSLKDAKEIVSIDWGLDTPLEALNGADSYTCYKDEWPLINLLQQIKEPALHESKAKSLFYPLPVNGFKYFASHKLTQEFMKGNDELVEKLAQKEHFKLEEIEVPSKSPYLLWRVVHN